LGGLSAVAA
jgi:hypothetical protein